jgi:hypothetical protein
MKTVLWIAAAVALLAAIGTMIVYPSLSLTAFSKAMLIVMCVLLVAMAVMLALIVLLPDSVRVNYFLYDEDTGKNLSVAALTEDIVFERVDAFVAELVRKRSELWLPGRLDACAFGDNGEFAPLVAYKMLIDLGEADSDGAWRCFCAAAPETVKWIADTLRPYEPNMTKDLLAVKARFGNDPAKVRGFVLHNLKYLRARAMQYVVKSIDSFDSVAEK